MLAQYIDEVQGHLNDSGGQFFTIPRLTGYINRSRRRIAAVSGCLRIIPPGTQTVPGQEVYPFAAWNALAQQIVPQAQSILACRSLAIGIGGAWAQDPATEQWSIQKGTWKPMWKRLVWTDFQARFRIYGGTFYGTISQPGWYSQYGEGPLGALYLAPIPSIAAPMEVDLTLIPKPLQNDNDSEPIPYPWVDAVSYWATVLALWQQQRKEDAQGMAELFANDLPMCAAVVCPQLVMNAYGATLRSA
jgi:hypothetical protein